MELGQRIKDCRTEKGMTQEELARRVEEDKKIQEAPRKSWQTESMFPDRRSQAGKMTKAIPMFILY